jgi:uncharacterized membrane protein (UPF0127 family)
MRLLLPAALLRLLPTALLLLTSCGSKDNSVEDFPTRPVTLPGGQVLRAETMIDNIDLIRGLMFRTSLAPDHGMLFVHPKPGNYTYFTYQNLIPIDIIWLDSNRKIVEMVENAQPCKTQASKCEQYGGKEISAYVLEIGAGMAGKYGLKVGQTVQW